MDLWTPSFLITKKFVDKINKLSLIINLKIGLAWGGIILFRKDKFIFKLLTKSVIFKIYFLILIINFIIA